jgi:DNA-binding LacI/PurR family transcriptional regulator
LTEEFSLSRNTVRKIIDKLIEAELLTRTPNKSVEVCSGKSERQIAFLTPAVYSEFFERLKFSIEHAMADESMTCSTIHYVNWEDPIFNDVLKRFDAVFLIPKSEEIPKVILQSISDSSAPVVVFERDLREIGVPSIITTPHYFVQHLMDHMASLGHHDIDCFNTQNCDDIIMGRIQQWQVWNTLHGGKGRLFQEPVESYGCPMEKAYELAMKIFKEKRISTGVICLTEPCAIGVTKAMWESGIEPGKDLSLVTFESQLSRYIHPGLTCIAYPDPLPFIKICIEWFKRDGQNWEGPLLLQPQESRVIEGGSCLGR